MNAWIGVDLDGTLAVYDHWRGIEHIGEPIEPMLRRVQGWVAAGTEVRIFTARVFEADGTSEVGAAEVRRHIEAWSLQHIGTVLPITNIKDFGMVELWDDRAIQVIPNTGVRADAEERGLRQTFELRWKADQRAIKRWQSATGKTMEWPDRADMVVWLLERLEAAEAKLIQAEAA